VKELSQYLSAIAASWGMVIVASEICKASLPLTAAINALDARINRHPLPPDVQRGIVA
jgi:hypothetical protein